MYYIRVLLFDRVGNDFGSIQKPPILTDKSIRAFDRGGDEGINVDRTIAIALMLILITRCWFVTCQPMSEFFHKSI
ncbi:hypothetical protein, partial [Chamaesiphon sp. GL140_3_metabinner_50]|uniref:hypothetical protein n=1 Tax=Chamaesiphon sp. GL140_3_metabinner_50 TaxID=2970812 RepID=UPI0025D5CD37